MLSEFKINYWRIITYGKTCRFRMFPVSETCSRYIFFHDFVLARWLYHVTPQCEQGAIFVAATGRCDMSLPHVHLPSCGSRDYITKKGETDHKFSINPQLHLTVASTQRKGPGQYVNCLKMIEAAFLTKNIFDNYIVKTFMFMKVKRHNLLLYVMCLSNTSY